MRRVTIAFALFLTIGCGEALASNRTVTLQRTSAALLARWPGEFHYMYPWTRQCAANPNTHAYEVHCQLEYHEAIEGEPGAFRWIPVHIEVECERNRCKSMLFAEEDLTYFLEDHVSFRGRKGTYHETGWRRPS